METILENIIDVIEAVWFKLATLLNLEEMGTLDSLQPILAKIGLREARVPIPSKFKRVASLNQAASITPKIFSRIVSIWPN